MADTDDQDLDLEGQDGDEGDADGDGDGGNDGDGKDGKPEGDGQTGEDKRLADLQSRLDKAEARANKAEAALAKGGGSGEGEGSKDPERAALLEELREASLDAVYGEFKELGEYGIDRALIEGKTRAEMRESATSLVGLVKSVATKARNKALKEAGVTAEPAGSTRTPPKDFASMSAEEFEKFRAERKGSDLWR
jgi:hypothetical protein